MDTLTQLSRFLSLSHLFLLLQFLFSFLFPKVTDLIQGIQLGMVDGENALTYVTTNLDFSVTSALVSSTGGIEYTPLPQENALGSKSMQPKITLGPLGLSACEYNNGYAFMSVLKWSNNPFEGSAFVTSPLLRVASESSSAPAEITAQHTMSSGVKGSRVTYAHNVSQVPLYTISLPFSREQEFNFSAMNSSYSFPGQRRSNFTIPKCIQHVGVSYISCKHCNISSFTNFNVTYSCFDIFQLCPSSNAKRRLLDEESKTGRGRLGDEEVYKDSYPDSDRHRVIGRAHSRNSKRARSLDDSSSGSSAASMAEQGSTYGTLVQSVISELSDVLSNNPFNLDIRKCKIVLGFTLGLSTFIILMLTYLLRLDYHESLDKKYVMKEREADVRRLIIDDLKKGGKGDLVASYQEYSRQSKDNRRANGSIMGSTAISGKSNTFITGKSSFCVSESPMHRDKHVNVPPTSLHAGTTSSSSNSSSCMVECRTNSNHDPDEAHTTQAIITEFMYKLFPGHSIFSGKRNLMKIIFLNHDYLRMFAGSDLRKSRTIRFLSLLSVVLPFIFTDTVFFGIYFPSNSVCAAKINKVQCYFNAEVSMM